MKVFSTLMSCSISYLRVFDVVVLGIQLNQVGQTVQIFQGFNIVSRNV